MSRLDLDFFWAPKQGSQHTFLREKHDFEQKKLFFVIFSTLQCFPQACLYEKSVSNTLQSLCGVLVARFELRISNSGPLTARFECSAEHLVQILSWKTRFLWFCRLCSAFHRHVCIRKVFQTRCRVYAKYLWPGLSWASQIVLCALQSTCRF